MRKLFYLIILNVTFFISHGQTDSLSIDRLIKESAAKGDTWDSFLKISDSIGNLSRTKQKSYILQVNRRSKALNNKYLEALSMNSLGLCYMSLEIYSESYNAFLQAAKLFDELGRTSGVFNAWSNIGTIYYYSGDYQKALSYEFKALQILKKAKKVENANAKITNAYINIGSIYGSMGNVQLARDYFFRAYEYYKQDPERDSVTRAYIFNNISDSYLYAEIPDLENAEKYQKVAFDIKMKYGSPNEKADGYQNYAGILIEKGAYEKALNLLYKALPLYDTINPSDDLRKCYDALAQVYAIQRKYKEENYFLKKATNTRIYLDSLGRVSEISNAEIKNEFRQQVISDSIQTQAQLKLRDVKLDQKKRESYYGIAALIIVSVFAFMSFRRFRITQKQKIEIENQKLIVDHKNREITESINYAKNLQDALIPNPTELNSLFKESFVVYLPKDIVAGDFYWWHSFANEGKKKILVASADCTGHGVPGAMVSVVCINALNRTVNEFNLVEPHKVLDKVNELVNETFGKNKKQVNDGMDISLLLIDFDNKLIKWSGANNRLLYMDGPDLKEIKPSKQAIGKSDYQKPFEVNEISFKENTTFYLFTDGYADQFGGNKNKKMGISQMKKLLVDNQNKSLIAQKTQLELAFKNWKNTIEQTDDVSLIGLKI